MNNGKKPQKYYFAWDEKQKTKKLSEKLRIKIFEDGKLEECGQNGRQPFVQWHRGFTRHVYLEPKIEINRQGFSKW